MAMRKDLWKKRTKLTCKDILFDYKAGQIPSFKARRHNLKHCRCRSESLRGAAEGIPPFLKGCGENLCKKVFPAIFILVHALLCKAQAGQEYRGCVQAEVGYGAGD
jgi:hypothetical protein